MAKRGTALLQRVFRSLTSFEVTGYAVQESIQPSVDVWAHNPEIQIFRQQFVTGAGNNTIFLPGLARAAQINGTFPTPQSAGARRWLTLVTISDTILAAGKNVTFSVGRSAASQAELSFTRGDTLWPAAQPLPLIRTRFNGQTAATENVQGVPCSVYVPDPMVLFLTLFNQVGGEVIDVAGLFLQSESINEPLPDMFSS